MALTKPEKSQMVENHLVQLARSGQLAGKVLINKRFAFDSLKYKVKFPFFLQFGEDQLINLLEKLSEQTSKKTVVKVRAL